MEANKTLERGNVRDTLKSLEERLLALRGHL
jgi:hypothetical protein